MRRETEHVVALSALTAEQWAVLGTARPDGGQILDMIRADVAAMNALPLLDREPIRLVRAQIDVLCDLTPPNPDRMPPWLVGVESITGVRVVEVRTVEESTPYLQGWLP